VDGIIIPDDVVKTSAAGTQWASAQYKRKTASAQTDPPADHRHACAPVVPQFPHLPGAAEQHFPAASDSITSNIAKYS